MTEYLKSQKPGYNEKLKSSKMLSEYRESQNEDRLQFSDKQRKRFEHILKNITQHDLLYNIDLTPQEQEDFQSYLQMIKNSQADVEIREVIPWWKSYTEVDENGNSFEANGVLI